MVWEPEWPGQPYVAHLDDVPWYDAPLPRRWHRCRVQTRAYIGEVVDRCACGAIRWNGKRWHDRHLRRSPVGQAEASSFRRARDADQQRIDALAGDNDVVRSLLDERRARPAW